MSHVDDGQGLFQAIVSVCDCLREEIEREMRSTRGRPGISISKFQVALFRQILDLMKRWYVKMVESKVPLSLIKTFTSDFVYAIILAASSPDKAVLQNPYACAQIKWAPISPRHPGYKL